MQLNEWCQYALGKLADIRQFQSPTIEYRQRTIQTVSDRNAKQDIECGVRNLSSSAGNVSSRLPKAGFFARVGPTKLAFHQN